MGKQKKNGKRLHLTPLIVGIYGALLGLGLVSAGLMEITNGVGLVRLVLGLGMTGLGLWGVWDGVRDLVRPEQQVETPPARQFILTDTAGLRTSRVTPELLREQLDILAESEDYKTFSLQMLPPLLVEDYGKLQQIFCLYHTEIILAALFELPESGQRVYQKCTEPDMAEVWLKQLLAGSPDFSEWEPVKVVDYQSEADIPEEEAADLEQEAVEQDARRFFLEQLSEEHGQMTYWRQLLVIFGESWHDEHKFFSARDVELAVEGVHTGTYEKVVLQWGAQVFEVFPGVQDDLAVFWHTADNGQARVLARSGTVTQVNFWLANYLDQGYFAETSGWTDVTAQLEKEQRRSAKRHGKVF